MRAAEGEERDSKRALLSIAAEELLEAWVGAEVGEVGAGIDGSEIAEAQLEGFLHCGQGFVLIAFCGIDCSEPIIIYRDLLSIAHPLRHVSKRLIVVALSEGQLSPPDVGVAAAAYIFRMLEGGAGFLKASLKEQSAAEVILGERRSGQEANRFPCGFF